MFANDFDLAATLGALPCPRCGAVGFTQIDGDAHDAVPPAERLPATCHISPSLYARCASCGAVGEWPGFVEG